MLLYVCCQKINPFSYVALSRENKVMNRRNSTPMIGVEAKAWKQKRRVFHACMCEAKPAELRSLRLDGAAHTARRPFRSIISLRILPFVVVL